MRMAQGTQRQLWFTIPYNLGSNYIDLAQCLSQVNRKGYSQNKTYFVEGFQFVPGASWTAGQVASCDIDVVGNTWTTENAWTKARALWKKMNAQTDIDLGTWAEFKVFMDVAHYQGMVNPYSSINLLPIDGAQAAFASTGSEWDYSVFVSPALAGTPTAIEKAAHMLGPDSGAANSNISAACSGSRGIIQGYGDTRTTVHQTDPLVPGDASTSWMNLLFDDGDNMGELGNVQENDNDQPPYAHALDAPGGDNPIYVGGSESGTGGQMMTRIRVTSAGDTCLGQGGEVLAGLLKVSFVGADSGESGLLCVNLAPGRYQGVAAKAI